jgi:RecB family exonuclease
MGFLETRALDFERLIILSANEGKLPQGIKHQSYIPFALRKVFKLPTFEEQDAIYSYHFKRLLQRAEKVSIVYNTEVAIDGSGEKSRLLWQLQQAFNHPISELLYQMPLRQKEVNAQLRVPKTAQLSKMMHEIFLGTQPKSLSATAIRHYLDCSLRFYFRYILKLPERETWSDELDARDFGNIVHNALEMLYQPYVGKELDRESLKSLLTSDRVSVVIQEAFKKYYHREEPVTVQGKDVLHQQIIQKLLVKVIQQDMRHAPFLVTGTELKLHAGIPLNETQTVQLEGTLDRVTRRNQQDYILDYKTGRADLVRTYSPQLPQKAETYIETHFQQPHYKSGFQGLFYAWLWQEANPQGITHVGVFPLKKVNDGAQWLNHGQAIPPTATELFKNKLTEVLTELFDDQVDFTQTDDSDRCRFCAYKNICLR